MIKVRFSVGDRQLNGFEISGHALFAESGKDIICAAVSSAAYMAANTVTEIIRADAKAQAEDGAMVLTLNEPNTQAETVLRGLELHLTELSKQYPQHIKIIYGGVKNA
ncbi:MAG: ribosomal-processing cysteine protease Prp [Oscillospiraceae bacterium]|nr:ribosomal-processing cysteine protease Prp [Clostridiaceae bacterium]MDY5948186.1 ribosomal-processing cysteine protease Prp [Oscillospiraceae bacterium]